MQKFSARNCRFVFRALLLFGVMAGLLFSCGEGIRLFPFPPAEETQNTNFKWKGEGQIVYQKNVHRFETKQENQSKFQRKKTFHRWTGIFNSLNNSPLVASAAGAAALKTDQSFNFKLTKSFEFIESRGSRAPPVSKSL